MKRIISLLVSITMVFSAVTVFSAEESDSAQTLYDKIFLSKVEILSKLGALDETHNEYSKSVTRLEFGGFLAGLLGVKEKAVTNTVYFNDTTEYYINNLVSLQIINGCSDGKFEPDRIITSGEAITMAMRALGYRECFGTRDGSAFEYSRQAQKIRLNFNKDLDAELKLEDVVELFFDMLEKAVLDINAITVSDEELYVVYTDKSQVSLLEAYRGLRLIRGQVTASFITSIGDIKTVGRDQLVIDNKVYTCNDLNAFSYIGQMVIALYSKNQDCIEFITSDLEKMNVFVLTAEEIVSYDDFLLIYQREKSKNYRKISFDRRNLKVIYNGKTIDSDFKDAFEIGLGTVTLYSADVSDNYSVAVIEEYVDMTVKMASTETLKIYTDSDGDMNVLDFSDAGNDGVYKSLFSAESGLPIGLKSMAQGDLISVCSSRDKAYIVAYLCGRSVIGEITASKLTQGVLYAKINGEDYPVSPYYNGLELKLGRSGKFLINKFGYIGRTEQITHAKTGVGYLYRIAVDNSDPFYSDEVKVKIYTDTKEHLVYNISDKVVFDGQRIPKSEVYTRLAPDGKVSKGLIKYTVNSKGSISVIETGQGDTFFAEMTSGTQTLKYVEQNRSFGQNGEYVMTRGTKVFMVPRGDENHIPENFNVVNYRESMTPAFTTEEVVRVYQDNEDPFVEYVVCFYNNRKTTVYGSGSIHMMVEEVVEEATEDGEILTVIKGYSNCMPFEIAVTSDVQVLAYAGVELKGIDVVEPGDWIVGTTNATGSISYLMLMYNVDKDVFNPSKPGVHAFHQSQGKTTNANYYDGDILKVERGGVDGSEVLLVLGEKETKKIKNCIVLDEDLMKFMIYDTTKRNGEWSVGKVDDIVSLEMTNGSHCDRVYFEFRSNSRFTNMAVYRH